MKELDNTAELSRYTNNEIIVFCREVYETILIDGEINEWDENIGNKKIISGMKELIRSYGFIRNTALRNFTEGVLMDGIFEIENMKDGEVKGVLICELSKEDAKEVEEIEGSGETAYIAINKTTGESRVYCSTETYLQGIDTLVGVNIDRDFDEWNSEIYDLSIEY